MHPEFSRLKTPTLCAAYAALSIAGISLLGSQVYLDPTFKNADTLCLAMAGVFLASSLIIPARLWGKVRHSTSLCFFFIALPLLCGYAIFIPPFTIPDEFTHINRVFNNQSMSELLVPSQLPDAYEWIEGYTAMGELLFSPFSYDDVKPTDFTASAYSTINYWIPSAIASLGKLLNVNGFFMLFVCRLADGLVYLGAAAWMLKTLPFGKRAVSVFLLNPLLLQQEASCSADVLCNIGALCFVVQLIRMLSLPPERIRPIHWIQLIAFIALIAVCKYVYLILVLTALLLYPKIGIKKLRLALPGIFVIALMAAVFFIASRGYGEMLKNLLTNGQLANLWPCIVNTATERGVFYLSMFFGGNLGWPLMHGSFVPPVILIPRIWMLSAALLFLGFFFDSSPLVKIKAWQRVTMLAIACLTGFITFIALWDYKSVALDYYQSRYLIPAVFLALFALLPRWKTPLEKVPPQAFMALMALIGWTELGAVFLHFS